METREIHWKIIYLNDGKMVYEDGRLVELAQDYVHLLFYYFFFSWVETESTWHVSY
jgi:hypothetical protein